MNKEMEAPAFADQVKGAVIWRSGSQIAGQLIAWAATFLVLRMLDPSDYGLVAMTGVVLAFLDLFNGWGFASAQPKAVTALSTAATRFTCDWRLKSIRRISSALASAVNGLARKNSACTRSRSATMGWWK